MFIAVTNLSELPRNLEPFERNHPRQISRLT